MKIITDILNLYKERFSFFLELLIQHMMLTLISVSIITVIGLSTGILMTRNEGFAKVVLMVTNFMYTIPSIALFGVLVIITGIGNKSAIIALVIYGLLPVIRNTYVGINEVDNQIIESAIGMGSTNIQLLLRVQLPLALPVIFAGFRTMVIMTIALCAIASFIGAGGLGVAIWRGITTNFPEMTLAGSLLVALLAIITDFILEIVEKHMKKRIWGSVK
ncbi:ABC transporter permease [Alkalibaculum sporogenes]|uniref:ABC transporter permease n=1 Tax=Alkalibaculum sporogenes TaxID=2655001 RepID=UPI001FE5A003|nr:ABC transporter permease [Alkalibaculum sporogenes]